MKKVYQFGNEFWIEGDWTAAATVRVYEDYKTGQCTFKVEYGSRGSMQADDAEPYGQALVLACYYARHKQANDKRDRLAIEREWMEAKKEFYDTTFKEWNPSK